MHQIERRHSPRQNKAAPILVLLSSGNSLSGWDKKQIIPGKMCNQSEDGLCIEIDRCLPPGSNVRIEIAFEPDSGLEAGYYIRDGLGRWCEMIAAPAGRFGAGIKILRKVIQAPILTSRFGRPAP